MNLELLFLKIEELMLRASIKGYKPKTISSKIKELKLEFYGVEHLDKLWYIDVYSRDHRFQSYKYLEFKDMVEAKNEVNRLRKVIYCLQYGCININYKNEKVMIRIEDIESVGYTSGVKKQYYLRTKYGKEYILDESFKYLDDLL